jgi:hypothetical protein
MQLSATELKHATKVNFWLPEDFAATVEFSESSMIQWSQLFWNHLETEYSGSATMLQVPYFRFKGMCHSFTCP